VRERGLSMTHDLDLTEDTLDTLVSIAILRAQLLDKENDPAAPMAWREVMHCERSLAELCPASSLAGGIARAGAVSAALAAKDAHQAYELKTRYFAETELPQERRARIQHPHLAKAGLNNLLQEVSQRWRTPANGPARVFPCFA
jgi:hypothetical protein